MTHTTATQMSNEESTANDAIRPFHISFPEDAISDLRRRVAAARWPEQEPVSDPSQGVQLATMQKLAEYWATDYDFGPCEAKLKALPNFITEIDGLDIHFIHVRSQHEDALPMIVTHGWPGSVVELLKIIEPLTDPTAHGGTEADAFHLVIPSMPGYGFSAKPAATGWGPERIATAWTTLMKRLGYDRFVAQGGDWGALISDMMGVQAPPELLAIHTNMAGGVPVEVDQAAFTGAPPPTDLTGEEQLSFEHLADFYKNGLSYAQQMANHPQTLYGVADSPVGLAAWILDHDIRSYKMITRVFEGQTEGLTRDDVLNNITLYWLTNTGVSSSRLYRENKLGFVSPKGVGIPTAVSVFPDEIYTVSQRWAEQAYPKLMHYNQLPKGGHFAAWEQPELLTSELRTAFRSLR